MKLLTLASAVTAAWLLAVAPAMAENPNGYVWQNHQFADEASGGVMTSRLVYGVPETDDMVVDGVCVSNAMASVLFGANTGQTSPGEFLQVRFVGEEFNEIYPAAVFQPQSGEGVSGIKIDVGVDNTLWEAMRRLATISYSVNGGAFATLGLSGSSKAINIFLDDCRNFTGQSMGHVGLAAAVDPVVSTPPVQETIDEPAQPAFDPRWASCETLRDERSRESQIAVDMIFINRSENYRSVMWVGFDGMPVNYANLNPGEQFSVRTYVTQPWMITDASGNCIEMIMPQPGQTVFEISAPSPIFEPE